MCPENSSGGHSWPITPSLEQASIPCEDGIPGSYNRTCLADGTWDSTIHNYCQLPSVCPEKVFEGHTWPQTPSGEIATIACVNGTVGSLSRSCSLQGVWGSVEGQCGRNRTWVCVLRASSALSERDGRWHDMAGHTARTECNGQLPCWPIWSKSA